MAQQVPLDLDIDISNPLSSQHNVIFPSNNGMSTAVKYALLEDEEKVQPPMFGKGNAKAGFRKPYHLYEPSKAFVDLSVKEDVWNNHVPFKKDDFIDLCRDTYPLWSLPRNGSNIIRPRKHGIESSLIGTFSVLAKSRSYKSVESIIKVDDALIAMDFKRNLLILEQVLRDEMKWPTAQERAILCGFTDYFNAPLLLDCTDCQFMQSHNNEWSDMLYSWKCTQGFRNMVVIDPKGEIRAVASAPAGWNNDQIFLQCCNFFKRGSLSNNEFALADGGFTGDDDFPIHRPFTRAQRRGNEWMVQYNIELAKHRRIIECVNGILKKKFKILEYPFRWDKKLFPLVFRVCCLIVNRRFRLYGYPIHGLK